MKVIPNIYKLFCPFSSSLIEVFELCYETKSKTRRVVYQLLNLLMQSGNTYVLTILNDNVARLYLPGSRKKFAKINLFSFYSFYFETDRLFFLSSMKRNTLPLAVSDLIQFISAQLLFGLLMLHIEISNFVQLHWLEEQSRPFANIRQAGDLSIVQAEVIYQVSHQILSGSFMQVQTSVYSFLLMDFCSFVKLKLKYYSQTPVSLSSVPFINATAILGSQQNSLSNFTQQVSRQGGLSVTKKQNVIIVQAIAMRMKRIDPIMLGFVETGLSLGTGINAKKSIAVRRQYNLEWRVQWVMRLPLKYYYSYVFDLDIYFLLIFYNQYLQFSSPRFIIQMVRKLLKQKLNI